MGKLMLNDRCYTGSDNLLMLNDESYSGGRIADLITKNITANGTYNASDDGADGYSEVNVSVPDYSESWIITNNSTTMSVHTEYVDGVISSYAVYSQPGNQARVEGDLTIFIGESSGWLWNVTATADMTYRIYNIINGTLGDLLTATNGTVIMSGIPITGDYTYEIRRYS